MGVYEVCKREQGKKVKESKWKRSVEEPGEAEKVVMV